MEPFYEALLLMLRIGAAVTAVALLACLREARGPMRDDRTDRSVTAPLRVLAVLTGRDGDELVVERACAVARERSARLTLLLLWSSSRWLWMSSLATAGSAAALLEHEDRMGRRLRDCAERVPGNLPTLLVCRRAPLERGILDMLEGQGHQYLVAKSDDVGVRMARRIRDVRPELEVVPIDESDLRAGRELPCASDTVSGGLKCGYK